jgi:sRNA-binding protein
VGRDEDLSFAAARRAQRRQEALALQEVLQARWLQAFAAYPVPVRPLATGIDRDLAAALPEQSRRHIRFAITWWQRVRGPAYWQALLQGGPRYDLVGQPRGAVRGLATIRAKKYHIVPLTMQESGVRCEGTPHILSVQAHGPSRGYIGQSG